MSSAASGLRELHELLKQLFACRKQLETGPKRVQVQQKVASRRQAEIDALKEESKQLQKAADGVNLQLKTNESKTLELRRKLNEASSNKEFDIFKGQIATAEAAGETLDEEYLEALEAIDAAKARMAELQAELKAALEDVQKRTSDIAAEEPKLRDEAVALESKVRVAEQAVPASLMEQFRRALKAHEADALAAVADGCCGECAMSLSPQNMVEVRSGRPMFCIECGRLMYYVAPNEG